MSFKRSSWLGIPALSFALVGSTACLAQDNLTPSRAVDVASVGAPQDDAQDLIAAEFSDPAVAATVPAAGAISIPTETLAADPAEPAPKPSKNTSYSKIGIGIKLSTLGAGIEAATPLGKRFNLRGGFNMFRYDRGFTSDGIQYAGSLHFQSGEAHLDYFPIWGFHVSPGLLFYNGNQLTANATVPGGQNFTLSGTQYQSDSADPVTGTGKLDFMKVDPSLMIGIGNLIPRNGRHYSFLFEIGGVYQGAARVALNMTGSVCDTTGLTCRSIASDSAVQANILAEQQKISKDVNPIRFFPVISLGVGFNF